MSALLRDLRFALRMLAKNPGLTAVALITLALGIGVNTATFSVINAYENIAQRLIEPDRLVFLYRTTEQYDRGLECPIDGLDFREQAQSFSDIGLYGRSSLTLTGQGDPEQLSGVRTSANLLPMLGLSPRLGRLHTEDEDSPAS